MAASQGPGRGSLEVPLNSSGILLQELDLQGLPAGWYNLRLEAADRAGNRSYVSRNFLKQAAAEAQRVELYYPADGETLAGPFSVCGRVVAQALPENVLVTLDGQPLETVPLGPEGLVPAGRGGRGPDGRPAHPGGRGAAGPGGAPELRPAGGALPGRRPLGAHLFAQPGRLRDRAALSGRGGRLVRRGRSGEEEDARSAARRRAEHKVRLVELSMDNGRSFRKADGREKPGATAWRPRSWLPASCASWSGPPSRTRAWR